VAQTQRAGTTGSSAMATAKFRGGFGAESATHAGGSILDSTWWW